MADDIRSKLIPIDAPTGTAPVRSALSVSQDTTVDQLNNFYRSSAVPRVRHSPLPPNANPAAGAHIRSMAQTLAQKQILGSYRYNLKQIPKSTSDQGIPAIKISHTVGAGYVIDVGDSSNFTGVVPVDLGGAGTSLASTGGSGQVLQQTAPGAPVTVAQLPFNELTGNISVSQMAGGSGASSTSFWRGDGVWSISPLARTDVGNTFTGHQTIEGVTSTGATGTGKFVFDTSPTLSSPSANKITLTVSTGTAPLTITSTTPVTNLNAYAVTYGTSGTQLTNCHTVLGTVTLSGGSATVTLSGSAVFTGSSTYVCLVVDNTGTNAVKVTQTSGTSITFTGTGTDVVQFIAVGN